MTGRDPIGLQYTVSSTFRSGGPFRVLDVVRLDYGSFVNLTADTWLLRDVHD